MKHRARAALTIAALTISLTTQSATGETVQHHLVAPGGQAASGGFQVYGIIGQPVAGPVAGPAHRHDAGYAHLVGDYLLGNRVPVAITAFDAAIAMGEVDLTWATDDAAGLMGFNVYRADSEGADFRRLNEELLPAARGLSFRDDSVRPGRRYTYRLGAVDADGEAVSFAVDVVIPAWQTQLRQNFPNPFNPTTTIEYYLAAPERVSIRIYDVTGSLVRTLVDQHQPHGRHDVVWDGSTQRGDAAGSGVYFYRLVAGHTVQTRKMTLLK